jgi:hypothetical protein
MTSDKAGLKTAHSAGILDDFFPHYQLSIIIFPLLFPPFHQNVKEHFAHRPLYSTLSCFDANTSRNIQKSFAPRDFLASL